MNAPDDATLRQIEAAQPDRSTWLSANAGSGKTRVLTDRVARLLLDGVDPQHILCLTYTKAAASEMQNRLFNRLGKWAMLSDDDLRKELADLGVSETISPRILTDARRLFARAIETPGGLKIQTIHAFCASILRRFPLEAQVSPRFTEMDDRAATLLRRDVLEAMADGHESQLVAGIAEYMGDDEGLDKLAAEITSNASLFKANVTLADLFQAVGLAPGFSDQDLADIAFDGNEKDLAERINSVAAQNSKTYETFADRLMNALANAPDPSCLPDLFALCLYQSDDKNGAYRLHDSKSRNFPQSNHTKAVAAFAPIADELHALMDRVHQAKMTELSASSARQALALHRFASAFLNHYESRKQARGWLDFDDLIERTRMLLNDPQVAAWVLFRLDGGIDHILVDEAQDTSPAQWNVIERLAQEFTAGMGARADVARTIFVVGDKKQSIYSFQGADPREFDRMRAEFQDRLAATNRPLQTSVLEHSFRSAHAILSLVDRTFEGREGAGFAPDQRHKAFFDAMPGRVDLWPVVEKSDKPKLHDWHAPVDMLGPDEPISILARQVAKAIESMIGSTRIPVKQGRSGKFALRSVQAGDILILVQRRSPLFHAIIRECKALDLPIAGADRLRIGGELAVRDIAALLRFLDLPEDDLSLATALKSPLFGWDEQALFSLAHGRKGLLWEALRNDTSHGETLAILDDLRDRADYLRPYEMIERILTRHCGRQRLLERLGREAEDGIDALLAQALAYEQVSVPSLTGFLVWLNSGEVEIKRQMESAGRQIRVMTVHGAKGLEAPIVILPDTAKRKLEVKDQLLSGDPVLWRSRADATPPEIARRIEARKTREAEERERLLYVAMTRAEAWLIVAAAGDVGDGDDSWYRKIEAAMQAQGTVETVFPQGHGLRLEQGDWAGLETVSHEITAPITASLPDWARHRAPVAEPRPKPLTPSDLPGAKALPGEAGQDEDLAKRWGRQVHLLLEILPAHPSTEWEAVAARLLSEGSDAASGDVLARCLAEARGVLESDALRPLFQTEALAEVPITASLTQLGGRRIHGVIDRLILTDSEILAVDFKTNAVVPETPKACPVGLLRQMGAYTAALEQVFPGKTIVPALLWTRTATLMRLPHDLVMRSLHDAHMLDAPPAET